MCPLKVEKVLKEKYNVHREDISTTRAGMAVKVLQESQIIKISEMTKINSIQVTVTLHSRYNSSRNIIYIRE